MKFGVRIAQSPTDARQMLLRAQLVDRLGFHSVWVPDHLHWPRETSSPSGTSVETLTTMSAIAALTERVELGFTMLNPGFRPPAVLAKMLATIDQISEGRLIFSLGSGWYKREYETYGLPFRDKAERYAYERELALAVTEMWTHPTPETVTFTGDYVTLDSIQFSPPPFRQPRPPLWFGGDSSSTQAMVAELADGWIMTAQCFEDDLRQFRETYPDFSRPLTLATQINTSLAENRNDAIERSRTEFVVLPEEGSFEGMLAHSLVGAPGEVIDKLERVRSAGIDLVVLLVADDATLITFAERVMPVFS